MRRYRIIIGLWIVLLGILVPHITVVADVDKLSISQIVQEGNDVYLYVNALDDGGKSAADSFTAEQFSVKIGQDQSITAADGAFFQSLDQGISYIFCIDISKSVTEEEMDEIRSSIADFVSGMSSRDYARIITIGTEVTSICDSTQDKNALNNAIQGIERVDNFTYLYKGISFALDGQRKSVDTMPRRAAVILFTDGMDDSDGASSEAQVMLDSKETRIPIYVVGLKGKDSKANLNSVGQIARQSGGSVFSYSDMSIAKAMRTIGEMMRNTYQLHVLPKTDTFGSSNLSWTVTYHSGSYSVLSKQYVYSLSMDHVVMPETELLTEAPTEPPTETPVETEIITEVSEPEPEEEKSMTERITAFVQENRIICIAAGLGFAALVILPVIFLHRKKRDKFESKPPDFHKGDSSESRFEQTLDEISYDDERTIAEIDYYDDEATVDGTDSGKVRLEFEITFDGRTETVGRVLRGQLVLGRGNGCDVDVVLGSREEKRKQTSRKHAFILDRPDGLYIKDNSKNRTYLNGVEVVGEVALRDEDILQMGMAVVKVKILRY